MVLLRHMKIAAKIGTGFGIVCALMAVITVAVYLSGISTTKSVGDVDAMVKFDAAVNDTKSTFYEARIFANVFLNSDSEEAYKNYTDYADKAGASIKELADLAASDSLFADSVSGIKNLSTTYDEWRSNLETVRAGYVSMKSIDESIDETNSKIVSILDGFLSEQSGSMNDYTLLAKNAVAIQGTFIEAEHILAGGYVEHYAAVESAIDGIVASMSGNRYSDLNKELVAYKDMVKEYTDLLNSNASKNEQSHSYADKALSDLNAVLNTAEQYMQNTIDSTKKVSSSSTWTVVIISVFMILVSILMAAYLAKKISTPLKHVRDRLRTIADTGDIHMNEEQRQELLFDASFRDEVGQCNGAVLDLVDTLISIDKNLCEIADGNLAVDVKFLSEEDSMSHAMDKLVHSLNTTFNQINGISKEIAENAGDVSDSSMNLAQGATEQTAAVAALGQSIAKVAEKTLESAHMAMDAAKLGDTIKHNAEKGTQQMDQMMDAVQQITEASASIGNVIKVIDDIAFQTNILALNAAVEAARAGQHGKGFAVVAEEVRNLAAKSAEAAKDTGSLIENSIQKADLGAKIATATSSSLAEIVAGINESSKIVNVIANSSKAQTDSINDINVGISQVGEVVHLISKGAELSSSASHSMREESHALHDFVSGYKIKEEFVKLHKEGHESRMALKI